MIKPLSLLCYGLVLMYGVGLSMAFSGVPRTKRNRMAAVCLYLCLLALQIFFAARLRAGGTQSIYPLIVHLPLFLTLVFFFHRSADVALAAVLSGYLCCQVPRWMAAVGEWLIPLPQAYHLCYILALGLCYWAFCRFATGPVNHLVLQSHRSCLLFAGIPFFYYIFDYTTTVYTDWLYSGMRAAVQFMPSVVSLFYFVFVMIYYTEMQKQADASRERDLATAQLRQAENEISTFRQLQADSAAYRHDMRHHFTLLQEMAAAGRLDAIQRYLHAAQTDLDHITPVRLCANETVNLILSAFLNRAQKAGLVLTLNVALPETLPLNETELCSLLSNGLENALRAAAESGASPATVTLMATVHKAHLLFSITNPYRGTVQVNDGLPQNTEPGHGYGVQSIRRIVEAHNGSVSFTPQEGMFTLRILLPMQDSENP